QRRSPAKVQATPRPQRVERAQQETETQNACPTPSALAAAQSKRIQVRTGDELLRDIRLGLQDEVIGAFDSLLDVTDPADLHRKVEGIVDRTIGLDGFAVTRDERVRLIEELAAEITGLGPLEPLLADRT